MLYQLSYLGTASRTVRLGAAVYSQAGRPCPPRFAYSLVWSGCAGGAQAEPVRDTKKAAAGVAPSQNNVLK